MMNFKDMRIGSTIPKALRVMDPEQSTQGGSQARQPIALVGTGGEAVSLTIGWMDVAQKVGAFKPFSAISQAFAQRSGMQVDFSKMEYEQVTASVASYLSQHGLQVEAPREQVLAAPKAMQAAGPKRVDQPANLGLAMIFGGVGIALGFGLGYLVFGL